MPERWRIGIVHERREEDLDGRLPVRAAGAMDALPRSKHAFVLPVMNKLRVLPTPLRCVAFSPPTLQRGAALPLPLPPAPTPGLHDGGDPSSQLLTCDLCPI